MNIDDLTLKQLKEIQALSCLNGSDTKSNILGSAIGKYVIVRTRNEGVNAGYVVDADETGIVLGQARRLHYHKPKDSSTSWYEGVANSGLADNGCRVSAAVEKKYIIEDYSITLCTEKAKNSISAYGVYSG